jgi:hypothetical protein
MTVNFQFFPRAAAAALLAGLSLAAFTAAAQPHVQTEGDYVIRASTVSATVLPRAMREQYGIPSTSNTAVLNITVQRKSNGALSNVPAELEVRARNLLGLETPVQMQTVVANDLVSHVGTYQFLPHEVLDFDITARPEGAEQAISLQFRDRLGGR